MKNKKVIISIIILTITVVVLGIVFLPKYKEKKEMNALSKKVEAINTYLEKNEYVIKDVTDYINKKVTSGDRRQIEDKIDEYLNNVLLINEDINNIISDKVTKENVLVNITNKEKRLNLIEELKEKNEKLIKLEEELNKLKEDDKNVSFIQKEFTEKYNSLSKKINLKNIENKINEEKEYTNNHTSIINYLNKDSNWSIKEQKIVFNKRNSFNEYRKLDLKEIDYELVKDTIGPVITAKDISITKGSSINIKDKVSCVDAVDGKVECTIDGKYDNNKVGSYTIKVSAKDESKNTSSKTIKLNVKEKVVNNKPYYIEVIRNHNVVIVYGLDGNNKYTKIVKVFICSVGKSSSKTPTGTFKTSDKASWGWLVGNLYGQYYTRITGSILFHSVPYTKKAKNTLEWDEYNKLGTAASKGCVRMTVRDVKWIYDNCPRGTTVKIYDGNLPSGVSKPTVQKISADSPNKGWDPTDPDKNNPWKK